MIKKAVILSAGRGTRVQPLTYDMPKPMIPLLGKPVMEYLIEHLAEQGIREIMVNVSHMADRIESYFGHGRRFGVHIGYSFEGHLDGDRLVPEPLGSAGALRKIHDFGGFIDDTTVVLCGDAVIDLDIQAAGRRHREQRALATVITREVAEHEVSNYGIVVSRPGGRVASFQEKPTPQQALSRMASSGIYLVEPEVLQFIPADRPYDIGSELFPDLVRRELPFYAQGCDFNWLDIGRVGDYWRIMQELMQGRVPSITMPGTPLRHGVWGGLNARVDWGTVHVEGPVYIGSGATIEPGCKLIGPVWVGAGCRIEAGATVERSVLFEYAQVGRGAQVREMIVSGRYCVTKDGQPVADAEAHLGWGDARARRGAQQAGLAS